MSSLPVGKWRGKSHQRSKGQDKLPLQEVEPVLSESKSENANAYVWLIMRGDAYLPGLFTSMHSIRRTNPKADLVVMYTNDVTNSCLEKINLIADRVVLVQYMRYQSRPLRTKKQDSMYKKWVKDAFTKWNALALTTYKKILFIDADTIVTKNIDHLFTLQAPAGPFNIPFVKPAGYLRKCTNTKDDGPDGYLDHGKSISPREIYEMLTLDSMVLTASTVLLEPSMKMFHAINNMIYSQQPYGWAKCHSMVDEQAIAQLYSIIHKKSWTNIHHRYNAIGWKDKFLRYGDPPIVIHYFSEIKPWNMKYNEWEDVITWYKMANNAIQQYGIKPSDLFLDPDKLSNAESAVDIFTQKKHENEKIKSILDVMNISNK
jgi:alpha-N-acetylglucosamine transferase